MEVIHRYFAQNTQLRRKNIKSSEKTFKTNSHPLRCTPRCMCPPDKPYLLHGFCKAECPGRRYSPVIVEGLSNRKLPEGEQVCCRDI